MTLTLNIPKQSSAPHFDLVLCIILQHLFTEGLALQKILSEKHSLKLWTSIDSDLDLKNNSPFFFHKSLKIMTIYLQISRFVGTIIVTLTLYKSTTKNLSFYFLRLPVMNHHTKSGCKRLRGSEDIVVTKVYDHTEP